MAIRKTIIVRDLELTLSIGVHDHEKSAPQRIVVSVEATLDGAENEHDLIRAIRSFKKP